MPRKVYSSRSAMMIPWPNNVFSEFDPSLKDQVISAEQVNRLEEVVSQLAKSPTEFNLFISRFRDQKPFQELGEEYSIPRNAASGIVSDMMRSLKESFTDYILNGRDRKTGDDVAGIPVEKLNVRAGLYNALKRGKCNTVGDILKRDPENFGASWVGKKGISDLRQALKELIHDEAILGAWA